MKWLMRIGAAAFVASLWLAVLSSSAEARGGGWRKIASPAGVQVVTHTLSRVEVGSLAREYGHSVGTQWRPAFAVLRKLTTDGVVTWRCDVYGTAASLGAFGVLEHELRHCDGWIHD